MFAAGAGVAVLGAAAGATGVAGIGTLGAGVAPAGGSTGAVETGMVGSAAPAAVWCD